MGYFAQMLPHPRLVVRALQDIPLRQLAFHAGNNLKTDLFQPRNDYGADFITPNTIYIEPTMVCNRRCTDCYPANLGTNSKIPNELAQHVFDAAIKMRAHYVAWIGGEPLLPLVRETTLGISEKNPDMAVVICTNADYLDDRVTGRVASANNIVPFLSIDGFKETHDERRGAGSYDKVMQAMRRLKEKHTIHAYSATLTSRNFLEITSDEFIDKMIENGAFIGFYTLLIANKDSQLQMNSQQFAEAIERLNRQAGSKPLYFLSSEYGRLTGGSLMKGKRLIGMTIDPWGGVRTERGGQPNAHISGQRGLLEIIASREFQQIFRHKANASDDAPDDGRRRDIRHESYNLLSIRR